MSAKRWSEFDPFMQGINRMRMGNEEDTAFSMCDSRSS